MENLQLPTEQTTGSRSLGILAERCIANGYNSWFVDRPPTVDLLAFSLPTSVPVMLTPPMFPHQQMVRTSTDRYVLPSRITFPPEAQTFAETHGATEGVDVLCRLALEMVPAAEHVDVEVIYDAEDGESSLHVTVRTSADADEVVETEEGLYDALFDRVEPAGCRLLSLGYDFRS